MRRRHIDITVLSAFITILNSLKDNMTDIHYMFSNQRLKLRPNILRTPNTSLTQLNLIDL